MTGASGWFAKLGAVVALFANLTSDRYEPGEFAAFAEQSGFDGVTCSDHYWIRDVYPHLWVSLAAMAIATKRVTVAPSFANNLLRSPFEFVQASVAVNRLATGRFEAGLGAGWTAQELIATGQEFPPGPARARRYREAIQIVRELLRTGGCTFSGEHYTMNVPPLPSLRAPDVPLVASVGGPWTTRNITPLVDRVELKFGRTTRAGALDLPALASVTRDELAGMVAQVREVDADIPIGVFLMVVIGNESETAGLRGAFGDNLYGECVGEPARVLDNLRSLEDAGIARIQLTEYLPGSIEKLAAVL